MKYKFKPGSVLGSFSKGTPNSLSLNFGLSGGKNCELDCSHHPANAKGGGLCYAFIVENRGDRTQLSAKLNRHEKSADYAIIGKAILELQSLLDAGHRPDWLRISTNGSVPSNPSDLALSQFRTLLALCKKNNIPVHMPIETKDKTILYQKELGKLVACRESIQDGDVYIDNGHPISFTVGDEFGMSQIDRIKKVKLATLVAKLRYLATGRKTIVCPAVVKSFYYRIWLWAKKKRNPDRPSLIKCGQCTACANPNMDIIYPAH